MSNALAIATVTTALAQIVRSASQSLVPGVAVGAGRPDGQSGEQARVRICLYQVSPSPMLRNIDVPTRGSDGSLVTRPTVAVDLHYLIAFYGNERDLEPQRMLGAVVRDLASKPVLMKKMIADAIASEPSFLTGSNLADSIEQVKLSLLPMTLEEMSKLWSVFFQTPYSLSVAYLATVVLIESDETGPLALPVLKRGKDDRGTQAGAGLYPLLESLHIGEAGGAGDDDFRRLSRASYPGARLGVIVTLIGKDIGGEKIHALFMHTRYDLTKELSADPIQDSNKYKTTIPDDVPAQGEWAAGIYSVAVSMEKGGEKRTTNAVPMVLAPELLTILPRSPIARGGDGKVTLDVTCKPNVLPTQRVTLILADREVAADSLAQATGSLRFEIVNAPVVKDAIVRLRIDGADSMPFKLQGMPPLPAFDDGQRVTVQ